MNTCIVNEGGRDFWEALEEFLDEPQPPGHSIPYLAYFRPAGPLPSEPKREQTPDAALEELPRPDRLETKGFLDNPFSGFFPCRSMFSVVGFFGVNHYTHGTPRNKTENEVALRPRGSPIETES